jgi:predicted anti-sigma-YlaC factor YlaD
VISCKRATELVSRGLDERLSALERLRLFAHLLICSFCRRFKGQMELIQKMIRQSRGLDAESDKEAKLSNEEKLQMLEQIRKQLDL